MVIRRIWRPVVRKVIPGLALAFLVGCATSPVVRPVVADIFNGFEITDRGTVGFGVPFVRSGANYGNDKNTALDIGPRGNPRDAENSGKAWLDVCEADLIGNPSVPVHCLYAGAWSDHGEFGTRSFNGANVQPLKLRIGNVIVGELNGNGLVIYGSITAGSFITAK